VLPVGGLFGETCSAIAVSGTNVYVTGSFKSASITLGNSTLIKQGQTNTAGPIYSDMFVAKIADAGASAAFVWGQAVGESSKTMEVPSS
jgi:hypothetical protein